MACNTSPANKLKEIVSEAVAKLNEIWLNVVALIYDQVATNQQMFRMFGVTKEQPCVSVSGRKIYFMFDPPHLLKSV